MSHSPGPWNVVEAINYYDGCPRVCGSNGPIAKILSNMEGDARLIAAAPEMLDVLRAAMRIKDLWLPSGDISAEHEEEAKALSQMAMMFESVINKATGTDAAQTSAIGGEDE